jgi:hypothetical protein
MPVTYLIKFDVHPDRQVNSLDLLTGVLDAMRREPCSTKRSCTAIRPSEDRFMLCKDAEPRGCMAVQLQRPTAGPHDARGLLRTPRDVTVWQLIAPVAIATNGS